MNDGLAMAILMILPFVIFIFWARSTTGKQALRNTLGDPHPNRKRPRLVNKKPTVARSRTSPKKKI